MESIRDKINRFYDPIRDYDESGTNTRYKSWEWCHQAFIQKRIEYLGACDFRKERIIDELALHLAFYLASWGMYRGSSPLLQRDYKAHKDAVKAILDEKYRKLWNYDPTKDENTDKTIKLLFSAQKDEQGIYEGIYKRIDYSYKTNESVIDDSENEDFTTDTLVTKILMGTYACIPAFDRYFKAGISAYNKGNNQPLLTQSIGDEKGDNFAKLSEFVIEHYDELNIEAIPPYPPMKCLDMFFWEIGFEKGLAGSLEEINKKINELEKVKNELSPKQARSLKLAKQKKESLLKKVKDLYSLPGDLDCKSALSAIKKRNTGSLKRGNA